MDGTLKKSIIRIGRLVSFTMQPFRFFEWLGAVVIFGSMHTAVCVTLKVFLKSIKGIPAQSHISIKMLFFSLKSDV